MTSKGLRQKPPVNFGLLWQVVRKHILLFLLMLALGAVFTAIAVVLFYLYWPDGDFLTCLGLLCFGGTFLLSGLFLIGFAFKSSFSSVSYYYDQGQFKRHGLNLNATLTRKARDDTYISNVKRRVHIDELELRVYFDFQFDGKTWERGDLINNEKVFNALRVGQTIPIRILPWKPESASVRQRALLNQLKRTDAAAQQADLRLAEPLVKYDEI